MKKFLVTMLVVVVVTSLAFFAAGCKEEAEPAEEAVEEAEPAEEEEEDIWGTEPITITLWTYETGKGYVGEGGLIPFVAEEYHRKHPNVTVEWEVMEMKSYIEALKAVVVAGEVPDIPQIHMQDIEEYSAAGVLMDLTDVLNSDPEWQKRIQPAMQFLELFTEGRIFMIPHACNHWGIVYWKDMWPNGFPVTMKELYTETERLRAQGIIPLTGGCKGNTLEFTYMFTQLVHQMDQPDEMMIIDASSGKISWDQPEFRTALETIKEMYDKGVLPEDFLALDYPIGGYEYFLSKKGAAFWFGGDWFIGSIPMEEHKADNVGWDMLPVIDESYEKQTCGGIGSPFSVSIDTKHPEIAIDVVKEFSSPEARAVCMEMGILPSGPTDAKSAMPILDQMVKWQSTWDIGNPYMADFASLEVVFNELNELILGKSIDDIVASLDEKT